MRTNDTRSSTSHFSFGLIALLAMSAATAQVATGTTGIDASGRYQQEVQACTSGATPQDRATCLTEARNAQAEKRRGMLDTDGSLKANAMARCDVFASGEDKAACQARVMGMGNTQGSVAGGGAITEVETQVLPVGSSSGTRGPQAADPGVPSPATILKQ